VVARPGRSAAVVVPLALIAGELWLTFEAGGFFAGTTAIAAIGVGLALGAWVALVRRPRDGLTPPLAAAIAALALFAVWTFASKGWSGAGARALLEFDRALLYALAVAVFALAAAAPVVRRGVPRAIAGALAIACGCGLVTRLLPDVWPVAADLEFERLSFPITYWNAQGAMAALAIVACLHLACSVREPLAVRALAAGAVPVVATALLFTFSRGGIWVAPIGVVAYLLLARPRGAVAALLAIAPPTAVALLVAYGADAVVEEIAPTAAGIDEGYGAALVVAGCALAAAALLVALRPLDARIARWQPPPASRGIQLAVATALVLALAATAVAADAPGLARDQVDRLSSATFVNGTGDSRQRLTSLADNGRVDQWRVAIDAFGDEPVRGAGAGTYALLWTSGRDTDQDVTDGHSLYLEVLAELGAIGLALLAVALACLLAAPRIRGPDRGAGAASVALLLTWGVHAGIDWDWELPALTLPVLAFAATTAARPGAPEPRRATGQPALAPRVLAAVAVLALLVVPLAIARSQSRLDTATAALRAGDCREAIASARASSDALSWRAEPLQIVALCQARLGHVPAAIASMQAALRRDPHNWRVLHGLAILQAAEGRDPRPLLREALRRNPRSGLLRRAIARFDTEQPDAWRQRALTAPVPL
jgi:hypothetical protein